MEVEVTPEQQRKMLEAAAKACGVDYWVVRFAPRSAPVERLHTTANGETVEWNPLTNPANTAEMCAKLGIDTVWAEEHVVCHVGSEMLYEVIELYKDHDNSRLKAWMFAATMVAAKIGDLK